MSQYFPKPYEPFGGDINVKVDLSNYATKTDIKSISHIDTSSFALKSNLTSIQTEVDKLDINKLKSLPNDLRNLKSKVSKLDIDKLAPVPVELSKLSNVVKLRSLKRLNIVLRQKIPDITNLSTKIILNTKINEVKIEIPSISGLETISTLIAAQNKIPNVSNLVKKHSI